MSKERYSDLMAFLAVARERSFTRAAAQLGVSQSALSHSISALEARMGVRLLTRTTRSVSPTEMGERLVQNVAPRFHEIEAELAAIGEFRDKPAGTIRITASENAAESVLWPKLATFLPAFPQIKVEVTVEPRMVDIVAERYDMGVRLGADVAKDMVAVRISEDMQFVVVGSPTYFQHHASPTLPKDLIDHDCINLRLMSHGDIYAWEFAKGEQQVKARVDGQLVFNGTRLILQAALNGSGLGYLPVALVRPYLVSGQLAQVLGDWCPSFPGYHLYYPSRRQLSRAMSMLIDALRHDSVATPRVTDAASASGR